MTNRIHIKQKQILPKTARKVFDGVIFDVYQWKQKMFDGNHEIFEMLKRPDTAVIIPITTNNKIIIQIQTQPHKPKRFTLPGGRVEDPKNIDLEALRELKEETGYAPKTIKLWKSYQAGSKFDWFVHYFIAQGCEKGCQQNLDAGEKIKLKFIDFETFLDLVRERKYNPKGIEYELYRACFDKKYREELRKLLFE